MANIGSFGSRWSGEMLSVLRIVAGLLFMMHGTQKLFNVPPSAQGGGSPELLSLIGIAGILEAFGGLLIVFGLFTRPVAFILSGLMAVAYFMAHAPKAPLPIMNGGETAVIYCFLFLYLVAAGAGPWSLDAVRRNTHRSGSQLPRERRVVREEVPTREHVVH